MVVVAFAGTSTSGWRWHWRCTTSSPHFSAATATATGRSKSTRDGGFLVAAGQAVIHVLAVIVVNIIVGGAVTNMIVTAFVVASLYGLVEQSVFQQFYLLRIVMASSIVVVVVVLAALLKKGRSTGQRSFVPGIIVVAFAVVQRIVGRYYRRHTATRGTETGSVCARRCLGGGGLVLTIVVGSNAISVAIAVVGTVLCSRGILVLFFFCCPIAVAVAVAIATTNNGGQAAQPLPGGLDFLLPTRPELFRSGPQPLQLGNRLGRRCCCYCCFRKWHHFRDDHTGLCCRRWVLVPFGLLLLLLHRLRCCRCL
mmetsp:Transcript_12608/g.26534  ORF Transcript_12608/g.26534 Transcript_12608/m.26534 type:complete len:310 (+) Transcript_12608:1298-2227(+)